MEPEYPEYGTCESLPTLAGGGYPIRTKSGKNSLNARLTGAMAILLALIVGPAGRAQQVPREGSAASAAHAPGHWWAEFAAGFGSSILAHEGAHILAAYALGGRPSFGFDAGRPTIYSGIDAQLEPHKQFVFSSAGLSVQSLIDEGILDAPHSSRRAGPFERGVLAGGIATSLFYVTIGRTGSVSDVDYMARTSSLSKTTLTVIYGGTALMHVWRISHNGRYANFFTRPDPAGGVRIGVDLEQ